MTNDEINRKLHKAMGKEVAYTAHLTVNGQCIKDGSSAKAYSTPPEPACPECGYAVVISDTPIPDYCNSLDAVREVEMFVIDRVGRRAYGEALCDEIGTENLHYNPNVNYGDAADIATATALQQATACLKALEGAK